MDTAGLAGNNGHCHVLGTLQCKLSPLEKGETTPNSKISKNSELINIFTQLGVLGEIWLLFRASFVVSVVEAIFVETLNG